MSGYRIPAGENTHYGAFDFGVFFFFLGFISFALALVVYIPVCILLKGQLDLQIGRCGKDPD